MCADAPSETVPPVPRYLSVPEEESTPEDEDANLRIVLHWAR
jgi:hypothetical protein